MESRRELIKQHVRICHPGDNFIMTFYGLEEFRSLLFEFRTKIEVIQVLSESPGGAIHYHVIFRRRV